MGGEIHGDESYGPRIRKKSPTKRIQDKLHRNYKP